jgi:hypothetical protein
MTAEGNDPLTKMAISATQTHTIFRYFSSLFFSTPPDKFFSDSAGPFTELRSGAFAILASFGLFPRWLVGLAYNDVHQYFAESLTHARKKGRTGLALAISKHDRGLRVLEQHAMPRVD